MTLEIAMVAHVGDVPEWARKGSNASHIMLAAPTVLGSWDVKGICATAVGSSGDDAVTMGTDIDGPACKRCERIYAGLVERQTAMADGTDTREESAPVADAAKREENLAAIFAPEIGIDGKPWVPGDNPARRAPDEAEAAKAFVPLTIPTIGRSTSVPQVDRTELIAAEKARRAERKAAREERDSSAPTLPGTDVIASTGLTADAMAAKVAEHYANGNAVPAEIATLPDPYAPAPVRTWDVTAEGTDSGDYIGCDGAGAVNFVNAEGTHGKCTGCSAYIPLLPEPEVRESAAPKLTGEPCSGVGSAPVSGSRVMRDDHTVSVPDGFQGKHSGKCPGCPRVIAVSREGGMRQHQGTVAAAAITSDGNGDAPVGRIGSHFAGGISAPANRKALSSKSVDTVEHGSTPGSPTDALKRRTDEIKCPKSRKTIKGATGGTITCPNEECGRPVELKSRPTKKGKAWFVPDHSLPGDLIVATTVGKSGTAPVERVVTPRGEGRDMLMNVREHGSVSGSANVGAVDMPAVRPGGWVGHAGTGQLPATVRPGIDPHVIGDICPLEECGGQTVDVAHKDKSSSWRRRHNAKKGAVLRERQAKQDAERAAGIARGEAIPTAERRERRKAASVGSFAEGVNAHTGLVTHGARGGKAPAPKFAPETRGERATRRKAAKAAA